MPTPWIIRPVILIAEPVPYEGISSRKLVLETAYFNVLTAYSAEEAVATVEHFDVSAVVIHGGFAASGIQRIAFETRRVRDGIPLIYLARTPGAKSDGFDHFLDSDDPRALLDLAIELLGNPNPKLSGFETRFDNIRPV